MKQMVVESEVREQILEIERADMHPIRKVRKLLALHSEVRKGMRRLTEVSMILDNDGFDDERDRIDRSSDKLDALTDEIRRVAQQILSDARMSDVGRTAHAFPTHLG
jgi:hypothetical protein